MAKSTIAATIARLTGAVAKATAGVKLDVDTIRTDIATKQAALDEIQFSNVSASELQANARAVVDALARKRPTVFGAASQTFLSYDGERQFTGWPEAGFDIPGASAGELMAMMEPEKLTAFIIARSAPPGPLDARQRYERRTELESELDGLERAEELAIREAAAAGVNIDRRPDAKPEIVLAPDGELTP